VGEFTTRTFDNDILPLLASRTVFKDEITFPRPGGVDVTAISLWDNKASADTYGSNSYPEVLKTMARFIEGTPTFRPLTLLTRPSIRSPFTQSR